MAHYFSGKINCRILRRPVKIIGPRERTPHTLCVRRYNSQRLTAILVSSLQIWKKVNLTLYFVLRYLSIPVIYDQLQIHYWYLVQIDQVQNSN